MRAEGSNRRAQSWGWSLYATPQRSARDLEAVRSPLGLLPTRKLDTHFPAPRGRGRGRFRKGGLPWGYLKSIPFSALSPPLSLERAELDGAGSAAAMCASRQLSLGAPNSGARARVSNARPSFPWLIRRWRGNAEKRSTSGPRGSAQPRNANLSEWRDLGRDSGNPGLIWHRGSEGKLVPVVPISPMPEELLLGLPGASNSSTVRRHPLFFQQWGAVAGKLPPPPAG